MAERDTAVSLAGQVYEALLELIVHGELAPGARIVERNLARRLGVSRTPVREALRRLQQDGLVVENTASQYARPMVATLSERDARELYDIVARLEALAGRRAAELPDDARTRVVDAMRRANDAYRRAGDDPETVLEELVALDLRFHAAYVEAAAGPRLLSMRQAVKPQLARYAHKVPRDIGAEVRRSVREHDQIVDAVAAGDPEAAERAVLDNWQRAWLRLETILRSLDEEASPDRLGAAR